MDEKQHYEQVDLPFYENCIAPVLPAEVLDFHAHIWTHDQWKEVPWEKGEPGARYMVTLPDYDVEDLQADGRRIFPGRTYKAVCFGNPTPAADVKLTNEYVAQASRAPNLFPLMLAGHNLVPRDRMIERLEQDHFLGFKLFLDWFGNDYANLRVEDMVGPDEMDLAHEYHLIVLLHVPRSGRLADPEIQSGVQRLSETYPNAQIVLAHCGRCYLPDEMKRAVLAIRDLDNVYMDTSMVMEPCVLRMVFEEIDSRRVLFATDFPVANMRGRRVYVMDHWVDVVLKGYPSSDFRVSSDGIRATFMAYEIVLAIQRAAEGAGLSEAQMRAVFHDNGAALLKRVKVDKTTKLV